MKVVHMWWKYCDQHKHRSQVLTQHGVIHVCMYKTQSPKNVNNPVKIWKVLFMQNRYYCLLFYFRFQIDNSFEFYILVLQNSKFLDAVASLALKDESQSLNHSLTHSTIG